MKLFNRYTRDHGRPDLIHAHAGLYAGYFAARVKHSLQLPYVLTEHSSFYAQERLRRILYSLEIRRAYRHADAITVVSPALGYELSRLLPNLMSKWTWIPNVLDERFIREASERRLTNTFAFLNVAVMTEIKGQELVIRSFAKAFRGQHNVTLRFGGDGPIRPELERLARVLGVERQVTFLGMLDRATVVKEMQRADAFVLGSYYETFSVVLTESIACGTPIIATACGGPECIVDHSNGILVPPGSASRMAEAMMYMRNNISKYDSSAIRSACIATFGPEAIASQYSALYHSILPLKSGAGVVA